VNPQDPLASLHPLRLPEMIGWWPPAPGWWLLLFVILLGAALLAYLLRKRYKKNAYRRRASIQLQQLREAYQADADTSQYISQLNALLKSVALVAYPRIEVAAQHGETWRQFLNRSLPPDTQFEPVFDDAAYQKNCPQIDVERVQRAAQLWIKRHRAAP
jgi:hypothetical protein